MKSGLVDICKIQIEYFFHGGSLIGSMSFNNDHISKHGDVS